MDKTFFIGIVEDRDDPLQLGRVRVRVFGVHSESLDDIPVSSLPWAVPLMPATSASVSGIGHSVSQYVPGTMVFVFFMDGEAKQQPIILGSAHGLPQAKSVFGKNGYLETEYIENVTPNAQTGNQVQTETGVPVTSSDGTPVTTDPVGTEEPVDISRAVAKYGSSVQLVYDTLKDFGITNPEAMVGILATVGKETKFTSVRENMNYSSITNIRGVFSTKTKNLTDKQLEVYVSNPEKLGNLVYSNMDGNGDEASGDGYRYRGGGFVQLTMKNGYSSIGSKIGVDLVNNPDAILKPDVSAKAVAQYMITRFGGVKKLTFDSVNEACYEITKKANPRFVDHDLPIVKAESTLYTINKTPEKIAEDAAKKETESPNDPKNDLDTSATQEQIDAGLTTKTKVSTNLGFIDPAQKYPLTSTMKEQDTNRLARRRTTGTIIETKLKNRRTEIKSTAGSFSEPLPAYNASYPYNHVFASEAGHVMEFDDTAGAERVQIYHKSGTFTEIDKFGNQVNKIVGDTFSITERNGYIYIDGTARLTVGSDVKIKIGGNLDFVVDGNITYDVGGSIITKVGGSINTKSGGQISSRSDSSIDMDGSKINLNSGSAKNADVSARSGNSNDYALQTPTSFLGDASLTVEEQEEAEVIKYLDDQVAAGNITKKEIQDGDTAAKLPEKVDETVPPNTTTLDTSCSMFEGKTDIPDSTQLTPNYTLGMVSSKAAASSYKVTAQRGLSLPEIVCNLKKVALNCLEPIKAQYPRMIVTSGFRTGSGKSQHELGQAIDMQFGVSNSDYFAIAQWIKDNIQFDQLLLEYKTIESGRAWIHVSFSDSPRRQVFTYMNHKNAGSGLKKLQ